MTTMIEYLDHLQGQDRSPATLRATRSDLSGFQSWWERTYRRPFAVQQLAPRDLRRWQRERQQVDGAKPNTINRALSSLRGFCQWAVLQGMRPDNPVTEIADIPTPDLAPQGLDDETIDLLLRVASSRQDLIQRRRDQAALALLVYGGLRIQEVCQVHLRDLDLEGGMVTVRCGKGGKARRVPLHSEAHDLLQRYIDDVRCPDGLPPVGSEAEREPLLIGQQVAVKGQPRQPGLQPQTLRKRLKQLGRDAAHQLQAAAVREPDLRRAGELRRLAQQSLQVTPHQLRHSLARRLLRHGATLPEVQRLLGHSRLSTTGMYLVPSEGDLRNAIERAGV
jgi:site-specific recombinase XerD